jgi:putative PIG3 family NAD(P)H quinone oxidoreductase
MKAIRITQPGGPEVLQIAEIDDPVPGPEELLVDIRATALNRADLLQRRGLYPAPPGVLPDVPGLEFAGVVEAVGTRVQEYHTGDRVFGLLAGGGYAEKVTVHERMALPVPESFSFEEAAAVPEVFLTAYDALSRQCDLRSGEALLIHAVGSGVGTAAVQLAKAASAGPVFGTAGSEEKLARAAALGLDHGINYRSADFRDVVLTETNGRGVQVLLDVVGAPYLERNLACLAPLGRMILVGLLGGSQQTIDLAQVLRKRLRIFGTVLRARPLEEKIAVTQAFRQHVLPLFRAGKIKPVIDRVFEFEEVADAHRYMEENRNFGKIVVRVSA